MCSAAIKQYGFEHHTWFHSPHNYSLKHSSLVSSRLISQWHIQLLFFSRLRWNCDTSCRDYARMRPPGSNTITINYLLWISAKDPPATAATAKARAKAKTKGRKAQWDELTIAVRENRPTEEQAHYVKAGSDKDTVDDNEGHYHSIMEADLICIDGKTCFFLYFIFDIYPRQPFHTGHHNRPEWKTAWYTPTCGRQHVTAWYFSWCLSKKHPMYIQTNWMTMCTQHDMHYVCLLTKQCPLNRKHSWA